MWFVCQDRLISEFKENCTVHNVASIVQLMLTVLMVLQIRIYRCAATNIKTESYQSILGGPWLPID
jgi:hypothetical protein